MTGRSPSLVRALTGALRSVGSDPRDAGTVALARRLAAVIEDSEAVAAELEQLRPEDESTAAAVARLRAKVEAQAVLEDLAPKLLATLAALGMTPASRASTAKGAGAGVAPSTAASTLDELRARRSRGNQG